MPTSGHFIFIPAVMLVGILIGYILGSRAQADLANLEARREEEREAARIARAERKAARAKAAAESE